MTTRHAAAFDAYVEPARERSELWRTLLGFALIAALFLLVVAGLAAAVVFAGESIQLGMGYRLAFELNAGTTIFATLSMIGVLGLTIPSLWLVLRYLHKRPLGSVISPSGRINWRMWRIAAGVVMAIASLDMVMTFFGEDVTRQMEISTWLPWAALALVLVFLQTAAEELVFRGYLQQQLAARFQSRWVWMVLPSVLFGALHWNTTTYGDNAYLVIAIATLIGLIAADMTARLGNLSAALGMHFANNVFVMILLNVKGQLSGVSLYLHEMDAKSPETAVGLSISLVAMVVIYGIFVLIHRRRRL